MLLLLPPSLVLLLVLTPAQSLRNTSSSARGLAAFVALGGSLHKYVLRVLRVLAAMLVLVLMLPLFQLLYVAWRQHVGQLE